MTPKVVLRALERADVPAVYAAICESRAELAPWMAWCTPEFDETGVVGYVERISAERARGAAFEFGIFGPDGEFYGNCALNELNPTNRFANLGYWIRTSRTRRGLATLAVGELVRWGFANTDLNRFEIVVALENEASLAVARRAGAEREGVARQRLVLRGVAHDAVIFSFVRDGVERPGKR
jgi:ribosomal-protein-serine acetyltransferase